MTEEEAGRYLELLREILKKHGLIWIVDHANEKIAEGKLVSKRLDERGPAIRAFIDSEVVRLPKRKPVEFIATEQYSVRERLIILLNAVELGLVSPIKMEDRIQLNLGTAPTIRFADEHDSVGGSHRIASTDREMWRDRALTIHATVAKIRELI